MPTVIDHWLSFTDKGTDSLMLQLIVWAP